MSPVKSNRPSLRLLVGITSYGDRNVEFLKRIIENYRRMEGFDVDVIVFSDTEKQLGTDVRVVVGLPSKNPWSLPFAHKRVFAEKADRYDLFLYSEDDIEVTSANIQAYLEVTPALKSNEIAGYMLYEVDNHGTRSLPNVHGPFHWRPESVRQRGDCTVAEFTNEHSAFYLLTQAQLKKAIASGGFLKEPYAGRYDMLCTASTDPYTSCGFGKVICISRFQEFLIHHLPNRYRGVHTLSVPAFEEQVEALLAIGQGEHPATTLCQVESKISGFKWSKSYYEEARREVLELVPSDAKDILSIGCGWGNSEVELMNRGAHVTALPLDSVIGAHARRKGIETIYASLSEGMRKLESRLFDCVIATDLLQLMENPAQLVESCAQLLNRDGTLILAGPNFDYLPVALRRLLRMGEEKDLLRFDRSGINCFSVARLEQMLERFGLKMEKVAWQAPEPMPAMSGSTQPEPWLQRMLRSVWRKLGSVAAGGASGATSINRFVAQSWVVRARLTTSRHEFTSERADPLVTSKLAVVAGVAEKLWQKTCDCG